MRVYTVHLRRHGLDPDRDIVLVKEGFSWPGFLFSLLWALWHRLWLVALGLVVVEAGLSAAVTAAGLDPVGSAVISLGAALIFGYVANDLRRWTLGRKGFVEADVVGGEDADAAERRFFDKNPGLVAELAS